jgi:hypothetical protein
VNPNRRLLTPAAAAVAAAVLGALGCSGPDRTAYPVEFQVLVGGKPAAGATVVLHPVDPAPHPDRPTGKADETGTVRLSTFAANDGAPAGEYVVTVTWHEVTSTAEQAVVIKGGDKLKGRHAKADDPAAPRVTVKKGPNQLPPIQL